MSVIGQLSRRDRDRPAAQRHTIDAEPDLTPRPVMHHRPPRADALRGQIREHPLQPIRRQLVHPARERIGRVAGAEVFGRPLPRVHRLRIDAGFEAINAQRTFISTRSRHRTV